MSNFFGIDIILEFDIFKILSGTHGELLTLVLTVYFYAVISFSIIGAEFGTVTKNILY